MPKALVISAHYDDNYLGCGATRSKLLRSGWSVDEVVLFGGRGDPLDNRMDKVPLLDTVERVEDAITLYKPDRIYTHSAADLNVDHITCHNAVLTATRPIAVNPVTDYVSEVYCYETASSTEWNFTGRQFKPNVFEKVLEEDMQCKLDRLYVLYGSEMRQYPHPRSSESIMAMAVHWGGVIGADYAEAFETVRVIR